MRRAITTVALMLPLALHGCWISPKPEPPQGTLYPERITTDCPHFGVLIVGEPGAAGPAGATIRVFNLDHDGPPVDATIEQDGSFEVDLFLTAGDEARFQVITDEGRSDPVDAVAGAVGEPFSPPPRPLQGCLSSVPRAQLEAISGSHQVVFENTCTGDVTLEQPYLRSPVPGVRIGEGLSWPQIVESRGSVSIPVEVGPSFAGDEVFFVEATSPERDRRPFTLFRGE